MTSEEYDLSLGEMNRVVTDAINTYNTKRPHYSCHYLTPKQMHLQTEVEIKTHKKSHRCWASPTTV
ncbi:MAG: integrase core domain-containing protein [Paludibacteraceae bacterium]|nr:integrase core domain-containing protein [Paludibacteraceae bacterium]